jgi:membrane protein
VIGEVRRALAGARADDLFLYAAALAFYGLISVAPLVVVALWVTSLVVGRSQIHDAAGELARFSPEALGADRALERVADLGTGLGVVAVIAALWPATAYGSALVRVLDRLAGDRDATSLRRRGAALGLVGVVPVLVLASLLVSYAGATAFGDTPVELVGGLAVGLVFGLGATFVTVAFIYRVFPSRPLDWRSTTHGALIAAATISGCRWPMWRISGSARTSSAGTRRTLWLRWCCWACGCSLRTRRCSSAIGRPTAAAQPIDIIRGCSKAVFGRPRADVGTGRGVRAAVMTTGWRRGSPR